MNSGLARITPAGQRQPARELARGDAYPLQPLEGRYPAPGIKRMVIHISMKNIHITLLRMITYKTRKAS